MEHVLALTPKERSQVLVPRWLGDRICKHAQSLTALLPSLVLSWNLELTVPQGTA